jgi:cellobiose phosphorylase
VAITQWILGIRPTYKGLEIAPVIPQDWKGFDATRKFRGVDYQIHVERVGAGNATHLVVDGKAVSGTIITPPADSTHSIRVNVTLGEA